MTSFCFECCDNVFIVTVCVRLSDSDVILSVVMMGLL